MTEPVTITYDYAIGARVWLVDIQTAARVTGLRTMQFGLGYLVAYWHGGERHEEWVDAAEITEKKP